jgi:hypothetical protein
MQIIPGAGTLKAGSVLSVRVEAFLPLGQS